MKKVHFWNAVFSASIALVLICSAASIALYTMRSAEAQAPPVRAVTMFAAHDLAQLCGAAPFTFDYDAGGGSGAEDGWVAVANEFNKAVQVDIQAISVTGGINFAIEARLSGVVTAARIWPSETGVRNDTATGTFIVPVPDGVYQMRLGMCIGTTDTGVQDIDVVLNTYAPDSR